MSNAHRLLVSPLLAAFLAGCAAEGDDASEGVARSLGEPTATLTDDFGTIQTVREMPDGRVLVADPLAKVLYLVDMEAGTREQVGSEGEGPGEYLQPDAVWPLPADSTLLVDLGNGRLVALGPDLSFGPTMPLTMGEPPASLVLTVPQGVDGQGRVYARAFGGGFGTQAPDSAAIHRIDRADQSVDTVGMFKLEGQVRRVEPGTGGRGITVSSIPLSPEDAWGVAPDGSVVVARATEYRVDWYGPDGTMTAGPLVPFEPLPIGTPEKEDWDRERSRNAGLQLSISISAGGPIETRFSRGGGLGGGSSQETDFSRFQWPATLPPIYSDRVPIDPAGRAWVRRHVGAGGAPTYDVFDRAGDRVGTVELDSDRRVIGFGQGAVYVVRYDEFDLNYLERYALPEL